MTVSAHANSAYFPTLDAVRGVAAISVMLYHLGALVGDPKIAPFGFLAVDLFFMMSGFVLARSYEPKISKSLSWGKFTILRIARIYPALLLSIVIGVIGQVIEGRYPSGVTILRSIFLIPDIYGPTLFTLNPVLWSLFFELLINLIHGAICKWLSNEKLVILVACSGVVYIACIWLYHGPGVGWDGHTFPGGFARVAWGYFLGVLLARCSLQKFYPERLMRKGYSKCIFLVAGILIAPALGMTAFRVLISLFLIFPAIVILATNEVSPNNYRLLASWLGNISYPLYAIHLPLLTIFQPVIVHGSYLLLLNVVLLVILSGTLVEYAYDAPVRQFLRMKLQPQQANAT